MPRTAHSSSHQGHWRPATRTALAALWLSLALAACGPTSKTISDSENGGPAHRGGRGGTGGNGTTGGNGGSSGTTGFGGTDIEGGTAGLAGGLGGASGASGTTSELGPRFVRAERAGRSVRAYFDNTAGAYERTCDESRSRIEKASGRPWLDNRPRCGAPYIIDGRWEPNVETEACFGCDVDDCVPFSTTRLLGVLEYQIVGYDSGPGGAGGEGAGGAAGDGDFPVIESQVYPGPYRIAVRYYTEPECRSPIEKPAVEFALP